MRRRRWLLALASVAIVLGILELVARGLALDPRSERWEKHMGSLDDLPEREQFLADREAAIGYQRVVYADYYLARPVPVATQTVNFREDYYSARPCPDSRPWADAQARVWFFGGSTMEDLATCTDARTLANQTVRALNGAGVPAAGHNFGARSFSLTVESIKYQDLLRREPVERHPSDVVFYDGYNDVHVSMQPGPGSLSLEYAAHLRLIVERAHGRLFARALSETLAKASTLYHYLLGRRLKRWLLNPQQVQVDLSADAVAHAADVYVTNTRMLRAVSRAFGVRPLFVLQPMVFTKAGLSPSEQAALDELPAEAVAFMRAWYAAVRERMAAFPDFLDLSGVLDGDGRTDFFDVGHVGPYTGEAIGAALAARLAERAP